MLEQELVISDLSVAQPSDALAAHPQQDKWLIVSYDGEISGRMLWSPARNNPPDVSVTLPQMGRCRIYIGIYGSGTVPIWYNQYGPKAENKKWCPLRVRLSDEDYFATLHPADFPDQPRLTYISEMYWKTAELKGRDIVFSLPRKEAQWDMMTFVAYVRLVPVGSQEPGTAELWPRETKRLLRYFDSNFNAHFVSSRADIQALLAPLRESDVSTVCWTTCREDTCYYPSKVGNPFPRDPGNWGVYPYWAGRDMHAMLDRGEDPLKIACDVAHENGLTLLASYRRMTVRIPPFVFPLHPDGLFMKRPDLWCADAQGEPVPHLSLAYPEVRSRMIDLFVEQAEHYDIDGIHMFFCRGMPFVYYEPPVVEAFQREYGLDPRTLPLGDERVWHIRARFFLQYLRELRMAMDEVGRRRGRRFLIAMHAINNLRTCAYFGIDFPAIARDRLVDIFIPAHGHFFPEELGEARHVSPEFIGQFVQAAAGTGVKICAPEESRYWTGDMTPEQLAQKMYDAGADMLMGREPWLGHMGSLEEVHKLHHHPPRMVLVRKIGGYLVNLQTGVPNCG